MWCPRCKQGEIIMAKINKTQNMILVCEECEAAWFYEKDIGVKDFVDFGNYMKSLGLKPIWDEITILNRLEE